MSIPPAFEADEGETPKDILYEYVNSVLRAVELDQTKILAKHAACKQHEDLPSIKVQEDSREVVNLPMIQIEALVIPRFEDRAPDRLRSLLPPVNFGAVIPGSIYRSSFPLPENFGFLKSLKLKSILTLVPEKYPQPNVDFMAQEGIQHFQVHIPANKETVCIPQCQMTEALGIVLDRRNHPLLIHCNKGKHRTGCVTGCFRKCQGESLESIFLEYHTYADPKARILDEVFIELFDERTVLWLARSNSWRLPNADSMDSPSPLPTLSAPRPRA
ncbi:tyrosine-protein phosphatase SIW14 [Lepidopterella palustris CBS 459.81]|uniref:diphosphoinositol-polyphosphate diphosphatase n=1 Tax=Lepidopterella palustris CBS 459.81 TaxID=1314670 RepID=A0A8E2EK40_9PEZI|nr:tyrosine-protein phosphatase SIW14 [Lepidopterella palustris CBS 459.81]